MMNDGAPTGATKVVRVTACVAAVAVGCGATWRSELPVGSRVPAAIGRQGQPSLGLAMYHVAPILLSVQHLSCNDVAVASGKWQVVLVIGTGSAEIHGPYGLRMVMMACCGLPSLAV